MSKEVGSKIGKLFSQVSDIVIPDSGSRQGRHIKILATINLDKALLRGANIRLNEVICWVDFKYEQLASFCYYCGKVGHLDRFCYAKGEDVRKKELKAGQYGEWLKGVSGRSSSKVGERISPIKMRNSGESNNTRELREGAEEVQRAVREPYICSKGGEKMLGG